MKKLFHDFFYVPKQDKGTIRDKVLLMRISVSVAIMIVCMMAIGLTAYAYFSVSEITGYTHVKAASWELDVSCSNDIQPLDGIYTLDNSSGSSDQTYTLTLKSSTNATAQTGYAKVEIKTDIDGFTTFQPYYTKPIGTYKFNGIIFTDNQREIKITVPAGKVAIVKITAEWGSCAYEAFDDEQAITPSYAANVQIDKDSTDPITENTENTDETDVSTEQTNPEDNLDSETPLDEIPNTSPTEPAENETAE